MLAWRNNHLRIISRFIFVLCVRPAGGAVALIYGYILTLLYPIHVYSPRTRVENTLR